jgi:hypothetical protein
VDGSRFDTLTRTVAATSRRSLFGLALGAVAAARLGRVEAATLRGGGAVCRKNGDCESGICGVKDATGRQRCFSCGDDSAYINGACYLLYPHCEGSCSDGYFGVVLGTNGINACAYFGGSSLACSTSSDCPQGELCIAGPNMCLPGCPTGV